MGDPAWKPSPETWDDEKYDKAASIVMSPGDTDPARVQALKEAIDWYDKNKRKPLPEEAGQQAPAPPEGEKRIAKETVFPQEEIVGDPDAYDMPADEAYAAGARNPWNLGDEMVGFGYEYLGDLFGEEKFQRKTTRGMKHNNRDIDPRDHYTVARDTEQDIQERAARDQPLAHAGGQMLTETIATAPLMATPFGAARAIPAAQLAARAAPVAGEAFASGAANAMPWGMLSGFGASEEETLAGMFEDTLEGGNTAAAVGGPLGVVMQGAVTRAANPTRAQQMSDEAGRLGKQADRARVEALGGTGARYRNIVERHGFDNEAELAGAAERFFPSDDPQTYLQYHQRAKAEMPNRVEELSKRQADLQDELGNFIDAEEFFAQLEGTVPRRSGYTRTDADKTEIARDTIGRIRAAHKGQRHLSPNDMLAIQRSMDAIGYPSNATKNTPRGDEQEYARTVAGVARRALDDASDFALPETREGFRQAKRDYGQVATIKDLSRAAAITDEGRARFSNAPAPQADVGIAAPSWTDILLSPHTALPTMMARRALNQALGRFMQGLKKPGLSADAQANLLRGAQRSASYEGTMARTDQPRALGASPAMAGVGAATAGRPAAELQDAVEDMLDRDPAALGQYAAQLQAAREEGDTALAIELHKLSADPTWRTQVRPQLTR